MSRIAELDFNPNEKMYRLISSDKLIIGAKYIIGDGYSAIYKGPCLFYEHPYHRFEQIYDHIKKEQYPTEHALKRTSCKCYEFVSQQPQWNMERRSVNMFLRQLIGDDHFEW